jgi:hypothetical protein
MDWQQARLGVEREWHAQDQCIRTGRLAASLQEFAKLIAAIRSPGSPDASLLHRQIRDAERLQEAIRNDLLQSTDRTDYERLYDDLAQQLEQIAAACQPPSA